MKIVGQRSDPVAENIQGFARLDAGFDQSTRLDGCAGLWGCAAWRLYCVAVWRKHPVLALVRGQSAIRPEAPVAISCEASRVHYFNAAGDAIAR